MFGRWEVVQQRKKTTVVYVNLVTGQRFDCNDQRPDTQISMILDWLSLNADPGDAVTVNGRTVFQKLQYASA